VQLKVNLNSGATTSDAPYTTPVTVYDSLGNSHVVTFQFSKTAANTWSYTVTVPSSDVTAGSGATTTLTSGTCNFDGNGKLVLPTDALGNPLTRLTITMSGLADGANNLSFDWQLQDSNGNGFLTQLSSASSTASTYQDGYGSGTLQDFTITSDGTIQGSFTNGNKVLGQIVLASFANVQGLSREGGSNFRETLASGQAVIGAPGTSGRGTLSGGSLENSNVDISAEFSKLIIAQRGFEANAKAITTFDEVMQDTIQLKR
jgi:flagellar hook protein FlgE